MKLDTEISVAFKNTPIQIKSLERIGVKKVQDLLYYFPSRYQDFKDVLLIRDLKKGEKVVVFARVNSIKTGKAYRKKIPLSEAVISDETGRVKIVWFHQPYIARIIQKDSLVRVFGKIDCKNGVLYFTNPEIEKVSRIPAGASSALFKQNDGVFDPIYPETKGLSSSWFYHRIKKILLSKALEEIQDPIPDIILKKYSLPTLKTALIWVHAPKKEEHSALARKRFAFEEIFFIQLVRIKQRALYEQKLAFEINPPHAQTKQFLERFPFKPTNAQYKAIKEILIDIKKPEPMTRLLEGDVGSGKTLVAATTTHAVINSAPKDDKYARLQVAYMAPTEILARQHFDSFIEYFSHLSIQIGLLTGSECRRFPAKVLTKEQKGKGSTKISRTQLLKWVENGDISILIGTHALIQKTVEFKNLAYTIIDEQHRFGVRQRALLVAQKSKNNKSTTRKTIPVPHLLSMTATPIPRTLALTIYGDLDLTLLDEMPHGRKPIITKIIKQAKRNAVYSDIKKEIESGRQMYVICPRIEEPDLQKTQALLVKSVKEEARRLKKDIFPNQEIEILHSKMKPQEKEQIMNRFSMGEINILVTTSVIEVGVNIPNATVIIIEGAERFGLAQLHQLRGRVLRSNHQAYCYLFSSTERAVSIKRLNALKTAKNGFELAELDLELRGTGGLSGSKQWGITDIGMEAIKNIKMVEAARKEAQVLIKKDVELKKYPLIQKRLSDIKNEIHLE